ncbi:MAG: DinB family protein [Gelidibacter sp.]|nr:DinB family protein [Gelidibacter sp.]
MQTLFDNQTYQEVLQRIENLDEHSQPVWGQMDVAQMLNHCQRPLEVANGRLTFTEKPGFAKKLVFKFFKPQMYNDKPWKQNIPTVKDFKVEQAKPFVEEKQKLKEVLSEFNKKDLNLHWPKHPFFGEFTTEQWGKMQYKHIDHHLRQFGV